MSERTIYRYVVPVDDVWHDLPLTGDIVHVASRRDLQVEVWAWHTGGPVAARRMRVFGTGHPVPDGARHVGAALDGPFVWHLMEVDTDG